MFEKGKFPIGIEYDGKAFRDFEIWPEKFKDSIAVSNNERAKTDEDYKQLLILSRRIKIAGIPQDVLTPEFLEEPLSYTDNIVSVMNAYARLEDRLNSFRDQTKVS